MNGEPETIAGGAEDHQPDRSLAERLEDRTARLTITNRELRKEAAERRKTEAALRESERKYRELVENANSIILRLDTEGRVTFFNEFAEKFFGYSKQEIVGRSCLETIVPPVDSAGRDLRAMIDRLCRQEPEQFESNENENIRRDGTRVWVAWTNKAVRNERGEVMEILCVGNDISRRKRAEDALRKKQRLLRRLLRLHARERRTIGYEIHDGFVQLATAAQMHLDALGRHRAALPAEGAVALDRALSLTRQGVAEARRLIEGLQPPVLHELGLLAAIESLAAAARQQGPPDVEFRCRVRFRRLAAPLETAIYRVVQEGLSNVQRHSHSAKARIALVQKGARVRVVVQDWGSGFEPGKIEPGHYGLRGIRERARLLGGRARVRSAPGQGTRICVELPVVRGVRTG